MPLPGKSELASTEAGSTITGIVISGKPVIGIVGGIGSGKSYIADLFGQLGCFVSKSDEHVHDAYRRPEVIEQVRKWWGDEVISPDGEVDRRAIARRVFNDPGALKRLEALIHPLVGQIRDEKTQEALKSGDVKAIIWDIPLLYEVGLDGHCDAVVFVDAPLELRQQRVMQTRGWQPDELLRREKSQLPLDKKRELAQYIVHNTADAAIARRQVEAVLSRILAQVMDADPGQG